MAGTSGFQGSGNDCIQIHPSTVLLGSEFSRSDPTQVVQLLRCVMRVILEFCDGADPSGVNPRAPIADSTGISL